MASTSDLDRLHRGLEHVLNAHGILMGLGRDVDGDVEDLAGVADSLEALLRQWGDRVRHDAASLAGA